MAGKPHGRTARIAEQIRRELSAVLLRDVEDPRLNSVVVSAVEVSRDLSHAKVFITVPSGGALELTLAGLSSASGFLKHKLSARLSMRSMPALRFMHDVSLERAMQLSDLIDAAVAGDEEKGGQTES